MAVKLVKKQLGKKAQRFINGQVKKMIHSLHQIYHEALDEGLSEKQCETLVRKVLREVNQGLA